MAKKKIKIIKKDGKLIIKYNWFSYKSFIFPLLPLSVFLIIAFDYSPVGQAIMELSYSMDDMLGLGWLRPFNEIYFDLMHIFICLLGVGTIYGVILSFTNKTIIVVTRESVSIKYRPLPTGDNKVFLVPKIKYLFIKKDYESDSKIYVQYNNNEKADVLTKYYLSDLADLQKVKKAIETFLELECGDVLMKNEKEERENNIISPYTLKKQSDIKTKIKKLKKGSSLDYKGKTWNIINETRYDWLEGNTEKLFELLNTKGETILLFVQQNGDNSEFWFENKLPIKEFKGKQTLFKEELAAKQTKNSGKVFNSSERKQMKAKQLSYISEDQKQHLRILQYQNKDWFSFIGQKVEESDFDAISNPDKS